MNQEKIKKMLSNKIAVIILAAGNSNRMGKIKQLLEWEDKTIIEKIIKLSLSLKTKDVFVVLGSNYKKIYDVINKYNITIIKNNSWENGIGSSISTGIKKVMGYYNSLDGILIILGDQPLISKKYLEKMIHVFFKKKPDIVSSKYKKSFGVPAIFGNSIFQSLTNLNKDFGAKKLMEIHLKSMIILKTSQEILYDIDTEKDYRDIKKLSTNSNHTSII